MVTISYNNEHSNTSHERNVCQTWAAVLRNFRTSENKFEGVYYQVQVECSNPEVPKSEPLVFMSPDNLQKNYDGPNDWVKHFQFRFEQMGQCKRIAKELHQEALAAQETLKKHFKAKKDEYKITVVQCKR